MGRGRDRNVDSGAYCCTGSAGRSARWCSDDGTRKTAMAKTDGSLQKSKSQIPILQAERLLWNTRQYYVVFPSRYSPEPEPNPTQPPRLISSSNFPPRSFVSQTAFPSRFSSHGISLLFSFLRILTVIGETATTAKGKEKLSWEAKNNRS